MKHDQFPARIIPHNLVNPLPVNIFPSKLVSKVLIIFPKSYLLFSYLIYDSFNLTPFKSTL